MITIRHTFTTDKDPNIYDVPDQVFDRLSPDDPQHLVSGNCTYDTLSMIKSSIPSWTVYDNENPLVDDSENFDALLDTSNNKAEGYYFDSDTLLRTRPEANMSPIIENNPGTTQFLFAADVYGKRPRFLRHQVAGIDIYPMGTSLIPILTSTMDTILGAFFSSMSFMYDPQPSPLNTLHMTTYKIFTEEMDALRNTIFTEIPGVLAGIIDPTYFDGVDRTGEIGWMFTIDLDELSTFYMEKGDYRLSQDADLIPTTIPYPMHTRMFSSSLPETDVYQAIHLAIPNDFVDSIAKSGSTYTIVLNSEERYLGADEANRFIELVAHELYKLGP